MTKKITFKQAKNKAIKYLRGGADSWFDDREYRFAADFEDGAEIAEEAKNWNDLKQAFKVAKETKAYLKLLKGEEI